MVWEKRPIYIFLPRLLLGHTTSPPSNKQSLAPLFHTAHYTYKYKHTLLSFPTLSSLSLRLSPSPLLSTPASRQLARLLASKREFRRPLQFPYSPTKSYAAGRQPYTLLRRSLLYILTPTRSQSDTRQPPAGFSLVIHRTSGEIERMELFPAHPDLQLQISPPPATKPMELGFWKRALDTTSPATTTAAAAAAAAAATAATTAPSLAFASSAAPTAAGYHHAAAGAQHHHHHQVPTSSHTHLAGLPFLHHTQPILPEGGGGLRRDLASMRPIRGIPVYNTSQPLPFLQSHPHHHHHPHCYDAIAVVGHAAGPRSPKAAALRLAGAPAKRGARAPRMRWTTSLHARFVHAVELLGGHESTRYLSFHPWRLGLALALAVAVARRCKPALLGE